MSFLAALIGRIMLAVIFILAGIQKLFDPSGAAQMLANVNLPPALALPTGVFELVAGLLLAIGLMTRLTAIVLAAFTLLTIFFFHNQFGDPLQGAMALKNLAITGGLLMVFAYGQVRGTYDSFRADRRAHKAELRAAHAEGKAEGAAHRTVVD
ncbi:DoxX family protein [Altererythrobacter sp. CAU 1778]